MTRAAVLSCFFLGALTSCGATNSPSAQSINLGEEVTLAPGASAAFKPADVVVQFVGVAEDSRCPRDVTCMWAGEVKVILSVAKSQQSPTRHEILEGADVTNGDYRIKVVKVQPEPVASAKIPPQDYRATLQVQKM